MLTKRLEILFDPKEFETVKKKAEAEGKSIACMIRETLREKIIESDSNHGNRLWWMEQGEEKIGRAEIERAKDLMKRYTILTARDAIHCAIAIKS